MAGSGTFRLVSFMDWASCVTTTTPTNLLTCDSECYLIVNLRICINLALVHPVICQASVLYRQVPVRGRQARAWHLYRIIQCIFYGTGVSSPTCTTLILVSELKARWPTERTVTSPARIQETCDGAMLRQSLDFDKLGWCNVTPVIRI